MTAALDIRWSTDLVTFFDPAYWGLPKDLSFADWDAAVSVEPRPFFDRMLDEVAEIGIDGIELAPAPGGWQNALSAYGSAEGFARALSTRGLKISSSYQLPIWLADCLGAHDSDSRSQAERESDELWLQHARFSALVGCETVVTSTTPRAAFAEHPADSASGDDFARPASLPLMESVAAHLNRIGEICAREGTQLAIHTDAYSFCSRPQDVDLLMELTDPSRVKLCIDAGHIALDGADPIEVLDRHHGRAPVLHWKDCAVPLPPHTLTGTPMERHDEMIRHFRLIGRGTIDWHQWFAILLNAKWSGWGVAELDMSPDPIGEIREALAYYNTELAGGGRL